MIKIKKERTSTGTDSQSGARRSAPRVLVAVLIGVLVIGTVLARSIHLNAGGNGASSDTAAPQRAVPVRVVTVERRDFVEYGEYFGTARGVTEAVLSVGAGGRVSAIKAEKGDTVRAGASLAEIDPRRAETRLQTAALNERLAREAFEREKDFLARGNSTQLRVDERQLGWLRAQAELIEAERMREGAFAIAPFGGTVVRRHIELYSELDPGDPSFHLADLSRLKITVGIPESDVAGIRELDEAQVYFSAFPDRAFIGTPAAFARARSERTLSYDVDIRVDNPDQLVLSGQTARVRLVLRRFPNAVVVPSRAVYARGNRSLVMVVEDDIAREREVQVGVSDRRETVILQGLEAGDKLVAEGFNRLADGTPVVIRD